MKKVLLLLTMTAFGFTNAQQVLQDNFSTYITSTTLSGQGGWSNNSSNIGGTGGCSPMPCGSKVMASGVSYLDYGSSDNSAELMLNADGCGKGFTTVTSGDLYFGAVINLSAATITTSNDFLRFMSGGNFNTAFKIYAKSTAGGFIVGITKGSSSTIAYTTTPLALNQNHLIIVKYSILPGGTDDVLNIYADPIYTSGVPVSPSAQTVIGTDAAANIDRLTIRQNTINIPTGKIGLLSVAKTWDDLAFTTLSSNQFDKSTFAIISNDVKNGNLLVKSNISLDNALLNIFDIQGRNIERKDITLNQSLNTFSVNAIKNSGLYIVEITTQNAKFIQKIIVP
jgi:hypothetical protein